MTRDRLTVAQKADKNLQKCFTAVVSGDQNSEVPCYYTNDGILMCKWTPPLAEKVDWGVVAQIVVPACYCEHVLLLAHESRWAGHLGLHKTYNLVLKHFFWPGLKSDITAHCRTCHVCQLAGKPNQVIQISTSNTRFGGAV